MSCVGVFLPMLVPYFGIAFASHLALDFLNHKGEQLFYPYRKRFSIGICSASGLVNRLFLLCGSGSLRRSDLKAADRHDPAPVKIHAIRNVFSVQNPSARRGIVSSPREIS